MIFVNRIVIILIIYHFFQSRNSLATGKPVYKPVGFPGYFPAKHCKINRNPAFCFAAQNPSYCGQRMKQIL